MQKGNKYYDGILGYMTFYIKAENGEQVAYTFFESDFSIPPKEDLIIDLLYYTRKIYEKSGMKVDRMI